MTETSAVPLLYRREGVDPVRELRQLREEGVVEYELLSGDKAWLITRHEDARAVLADERFSNALTPPGVLRAPPAEGEKELTDSFRPQPGVFVHLDPPDHTRFRRMLTGGFTVRRMNQLQARVEQIVTDRLDAMEQAGAPADLVEAFALPVPSMVICELLGVPAEDREDFLSRCAKVMDLTLSQAEANAVHIAVYGYIAALVARHRADPTGDGIIPMLIRDYRDEVTDEELVGLSNLLLVAGHETTANMLGLGTLVLLQHPDQLAAIRDASDPEVVAQAVEELLRYLTPVPHGLVRTAREDVRVGGQLIREGEFVLVALPSANRDQTFYTGNDPDRLDITREPAPHLAFGHGIHHCLGAPLARMELRIAFPALFRRFPALALAIPVDEVRFRLFSSVYGVHALPVTWY
ncbi:MAG: cytochrome P450 [Actinopolymorphaceae bacterium]